MMKIVALDQNFNNNIVSWFLLTVMRCSDTEMGFYISTDCHVSCTRIRSAAREVVGLFVGLSADTQTTKLNPNPAKTTEDAHDPHYSAKSLNYPGFSFCLTSCFILKCLMCLVLPFSSSLCVILPPSTTSLHLYLLLCFSSGFASF